MLTAKEWKTISILSVEPASITKVSKLANIMFCTSVLILKKFEKHRLAKSIKKGKEKRYYLTDKGIGLHNAIITATEYLTKEGSGWAYGGYEKTPIETCP